MQDDMTANYKTRVTDKRERDGYVGRKRAERTCQYLSIPFSSVGWELTGFDVHLIWRELERRNTNEYEPYKCTELKYDPKHRPHY